MRIVNMLIHERSEVLTIKKGFPYFKVISLTFVIVIIALIGAVVMAFMHYSQADPSFSAGYKKVSPTPKPSKSSTPIPTPSTSKTPTPTPTASPTITPKVSSTPKINTPSPSPSNSTTPTPSPTSTPTPTPTEPVDPTPTPTQTP